MGLVGAGAGFLLVSALVLLGALPMPAAVGTSLVVMGTRRGCTALRGWSADV